MNRQTSPLLRQLDNPALSRNQRALIRCQIAKELEEGGNYEAARSAMGELWQRVGEHPKIKELDRCTAAEVLLRAGALSGWIGSTRQVEGAQEIAKDLISESVRIFKALHEEQKVAEAQVELAICYRREGAFNEARVTLQDALSHLTDKDNELRALASLRSSSVEISATLYGDALHILEDAAPLFEASENQVLKGKFHVNLAIVLNNLGEGEQRKDYKDRALVEYAAASYYFGEANCMRLRAQTENDLGFLLFTIERFDDAHKHLDLARKLLVSLKDSGSVAQVDETRARVLVAQGRYAEGERVIRASVRTLER
ncbi:MAG TPA: hypothetical protein VE842_18920, partial [Pyrinomonadaceae bacterium]|nr:hypothetical protein [Pyrinomonadaceae bacterium]